MLITFFYPPSFRSVSSMHASYDWEALSTGTALGTFPYVCIRTLGVLLAVAPTHTDTRPLPQFGPRPSILKDRLIYDIHPIMHHWLPSMLAKLAFMCCCCMPRSNRTLVCRNQCELQKMRSRCSSPCALSLSLPMRRIWSLSGVRNDRPAPGCF
jgi:hypothetical protein